MPSPKLHTHQRWKFGTTQYSWEYANQFQEFNPACQELLKNWKNAPPTLVIHSEKDYWCPITEGLAKFNALQELVIPSRLLSSSDKPRLVSHYKSFRAFWVLHHGDNQAVGIPFHGSSDECPVESCR